MPLLPFLRDNARWLGAAFLLLLASAFGQTFFIALSAGELRAALALTDGGFATLYMAATLLAAGLLTLTGPAIDRHPAGRVAAGSVAGLAAGALLLALATDLALTGLALVLLRLFGQGMLVHVAFTCLGRWFGASRGRAVALATLGFTLGQAVTPIAAVAAIEAVGWRTTWAVAAALLLVVVMPLAGRLFARERIAEEEREIGEAGGAPAVEPPEGRPSVTASEAGHETGGAAPARSVTPARDWTRREVLVDPMFYLLLAGMLPPAFISNMVFFHQIHLVELRGWDLETFVAFFPLLSAVTVAAALVAGRLVDRFGALRLLPLYLVPFGAGLLVLGLVAAPIAGPAYLVLYGVTDGISLTLFGALWPEVYGRRHLGAIRSVIVALMVVAAAGGPGLAGLLIDAGVPYPAILGAMGLYCLAIPLLLAPAAARVRRRAGAFRPFPLAD